VPIRFYNHDYGIVGTLDAIWFENDILFPVEIKQHRQFRKLDRQELAFYWRLRWSRLFEQHLGQNKRVFRCQRRCLDAGYQNRFLVG